MKASIMGLTVGWFLVFAGCAQVAQVAHLATNRNVMFTPTIEGSFPVRAQQAQKSEESEASLLERGYAKIGQLQVTHILERCLPEGGKTACRPVDDEALHRSEFVEEATSRGADVVTYTESEKKFKRELTQQGKCLYWSRTSRSQTVWNPAALKYQHGYVEETTCSLYERLQGDEKVIRSIGLLWRHEPSLAKAQRLSQEFALAIAKGDLGSVKQVVGQGVDVNLPSMEGLLPLGVAAAYGQKDVAAYLLKKGSKINEPDIGGTPLHWASQNSRFEMVRFLVAQGANVNAKNPYARDPLAGKTPLFDAAASGNVEIIKHLISRGAGVDETTTKGITPLMLGAYHGHSAAVKALIESGANIEAKSQDVAQSSSVLQLSPLVMAALSGEADTVIALLQKGAVADSRWVGKGISVLDFLAVAARPEIYQLICGHQRGSFGFIDRNGDFVIPPRFTDQYLSGSNFEFSEGRVQFPFRGKWGFMDKKGKMIIEPIFDSVVSFKEGLAAVKLIEKWGFINEKGDPIVAPKFEEVRSFSEGLAAVRNKDGKFGFVDKEGKTVIGAQYDLATSFSEGLAAVRKGREWYLIDKNGSQKTKLDKPLKYYVHSFSEGLAVVSDSNKDGYVDQSGKMVIMAQFDDARSFSEGLALASSGKIDQRKYGFIDKFGKFVIEPRFSSSRDFSEGLAAVQQSVGGRYGYIDKKGQFVIKPRFVKALDFKDGLAPVQLEWRKNQWGYINKAGKLVIKPQFDNAHPLSEGFACVKHSYESQPEKWFAEWRKLQKETGITELMIAAKKPSPARLKKLVAQGADIDARDANGETALNKAALAGIGPNVEALLQLGANVNIGDEDGSTPLLIAAMAGHDEVVKILLRYGAKINAANKFGMSAVTGAAATGKLSPLRLLIEKGADLNTADLETGETPLITAARSGHWDCVKALIAGGADVNAKSRQGATAYLYAQRKGNSEIMRRLKEAGAR